MRDKNFVKKHHALYSCDDDHRRNIGDDIHHFIRQKFPLRDKNFAEKYHTMHSTFVPTVSSAEESC